MKIQRGVSDPSDQIHKTPGKGALKKSKTKERKRFKYLPNEIFPGTTLNTNPDGVVLFRRERENEELGLCFAGD